jgi:ATP/maltotriose-dependent transcriptional regulator MalT
MIYRSWIGTEPPRRVAQVAQLAEELGFPDVALELAQDAVDRARNADPSAFAVGASVLAGLAESRGEFIAAMELLQSIEAPEVSAEVPQAGAVAALRRARIMLACGNELAAGHDLERAAEAIAGIGDDRLLAVHLAMRAAIALNAHDLRSAQSRFDDLLALGDRLGDLGVLASAETGLAKVAREKGELDRAQAAADRARRLARIISDDRLLQDALGIAAKIYMEHDNYDGADLVIRERLAVTQKIGDIIGELETEVDRARICAALQATVTWQRDAQIMATVREKASRFGLAAPEWTN